MSEIIQNQSEDDQFYNIEGFTKEEQLEIHQQIDLISEQNRIPISDKLFRIKPTKKGSTLPLVINIIGIIAIAASFYITNRYFREREQAMAMEQSSYNSTEGSVIEELKRQSEEKLNKKQEEILQIQNELTKLDKESASLKKNMDSQIKNKELELRSQMEAALAEERKRLQSQNISSTELEKQLKEFQSNKENTFNADIKAFKNESAAALKAKEEELANAKQVANNILIQANKDKATIEADTRKKEAELTAQFNAEKEALTKETSIATQKLKELSDLQKNEHLIQDQLTGSYNTIISAMKSGKFTEAQIGIEDIRKLLADPKVSNLPAINKRENVELFFLDTLEKEIQQSGVRTTTDFSSMTRAAEVLIAARKTADLGASAEKAGNQYEAKRFYNKTLSTLPQISKAMENLRKIEASDRKASSKEYLNLGDQALKKGQIDNAIKHYRSAAEGLTPNNIDSLNTAIDGIEQSLALEKSNIEKKSKQQVNKLESELDDLNKKTDSLTADLADSKKIIDNLGAETEADKNRREDLEKEKSNLEQSLADLNKNRDSLNNTIEALNSQLDNSQKTIEQLKQDASVSAKTIENLNTKVKKSAVVIDTLSKKAARATRRAEDLENELNDAVNQIVELIK